MAVRDSLELRKPVQVHNADFLENSDVGGAVDLGKFPMPHWHLKDGGPYIGSGSLVIIDPDSGWVNASIYRIQVHARNKVPSNSIIKDVMGRSSPRSIGSGE